MQSTLKRFTIAQNVFKVLPFVTATLYVISTLLSCYGVYPFILDVLFGTSGLTLFLFYYMNYIFQLCKYHRLMIHYHVSINVIYFADDILGTQMSGEFFIELVVALYGAFAIAYALLMLFGRKRNQ